MYRKEQRIIELLFESVNSEEKRVNKAKENSPIVYLLTIDVIN